MAKIARETRVVRGGAGAARGAAHTGRNVPHTAAPACAHRTHTAPQASRVRIA